jgi:hypothetical protein
VDTWTPTLVPALGCFWVTDAVPVSGAGGGEVVGVGDGALVDAEHSVCYPAHPAWDRLCEIFCTAFSRNGADPFIGRRLPELYRQAGLADVEAECVAPVHPAGNSRRTIRLDLVCSMRR